MTDDELDALLRAHFRAEARDRQSAPCPDVEELVAYALGELIAAPQIDALREHVAWCPGCVAAVLETLEIGAAPAEPIEPPTEEEVRVAWERLRARLGIGEGKEE